MPVYKDKERNTYYFTIRVRQNDGTMKQIKRRGFKTKKEAKEAEAFALTDTSDKLDMSFTNMSKQYYEWYVERRKESSINVIKNILFNHLIPEFGDIKITDIKPINVMNYHSKIIKNYSPDFLKRIHVTLSAIFNFGIKHYGLTDNPARVVGNFEMESNNRMEFWELEEFKRFIQVAEELLFETLFFTLYYSGCRKGELMALTWEDVDFEKKTIDINKTEYRRIITKPKTHAANRIILMPDFVMNKLAELKKSANDLAPVKNEYVVFGEYYDSVSETTVINRYDKYVELAGVKRITIHSLRHSHASYLINHGVSALVVAQRLGHANVATTLNTYSHLYPSKQTEAVAIMQNDFL